FLIHRGSPRAFLFPYTTLFRSWGAWRVGVAKATRDLHEGWRYRVGYDVSLIEDIKLSWLTEQRSGGFSDLSNYNVFAADSGQTRSEEHTSELQSRENLVCRLLL